MKRTPEVLLGVRTAGLSLMAAMAVAGPVLGQSSFDTDPFASRFRERANLDLKFKPPEKGGLVRVEIAGKGGKQSLVAENIWLAEAAPGSFVTVIYQDIKLTARKVRADYAKKTVVAEGDVVFEQGPSRLTGSRLDLDLNDKVGVLTDGAVDLVGGLHLRGASLAKVGPKSFTLTDGSLTACEGDHPAWIFRVKSGRVTLEDYARLKGVVFELGGVPILFTPYLIWPALRDRASGFLIPGLGYNSLRGGYLGLSYYWAFDRSADATFSADLYTKSFFGFGAEVRARASEGTRAEGVYYTVHDPVEERWRWQTRGKIVSDDLGPDLRGVISWLDFSDQKFFQDFDRDFTLASTRSVKSEAFLTQNAGPLALNLRLDREEALFGGDSTVVTERRPALEARLRPTPLLGQHVFFEAEAQAGELRASRPNGQPSGTYGRFDLFPKVSVPLSAIPWLSLQADAGARITSYGASLGTGGTALEDSRYTRTYVKAGLQLTGPSFARLFDRSIGPYRRFKHVIEPRLDYDYLPDPGDFSRTPLFDEIDAITSIHTLKYSLVQRLLAKREKGAAREVASLEISRLYSFRLPGEGTPSGPSPTLTKNGPVDATLRVNTGSAFNFDARTTYDTNAGQVTSASLTANFSSKEQGVSLSLFDSRPIGAPSASAQLRFGGGLVIVPKLLRFDVQGNYDLSEGRMLESRSLLTIEGSCFKLLTEYRDLRIGAVPSRDFRIALNLKHVGSFLDFTGSLAR